MVNYSNGKIYKIIDLETNECYIGSTCEPILARRLAGHRSNYRSYLNGKGNYVTSYKIIANNNYDIVLIELFPCNNKDELYARESHYTQTITCVNKIKNQGLFIKLGQIDYTKHYNEQHKNQIIEKNKEYRKHHKDEKVDQNKRYNEQHREQIKHHKNTLIYCFCGCSHTRANKARHEQTKIHKEFEQNRLYYDIQRGLNFIKKLDAFFF
jgi:hypothetical protein